VKTACVVPTNGTVNPIELVIKVLEGALCKKIGDNYCALGLFALLDIGYFIQIQTAASAVPPVAPPIPDLTSILTDPARRAAICQSDDCNLSNEDYVSTFSRPALDNSDSAGLANTQLALKYVRKLANRMRCACFRSSGNTCYTAATVGGLVDATGLTSAACGSDNLVVPCGRVLATCDDHVVPCPVVPTCDGFSATIQFEIKNLDKTCYFASMTTPGSALGTISLDLAVNLLGTLKGDFTLDCAQSNPEAHVKCVATVKCVTLAMFDENAILQKLVSYTRSYLANTNNLDITVPTTCKINSAVVTYGESVSFTVTLPTDGSATLSGSLALLVAGMYAVFF